MGRPEKFTEEVLLDAARELAAAGGLAGVTMSGTAAAAGAPSGSVYHRFPSRAHLLAQLWLRSVGRFLDGFTERLAGPDPVESCEAAARYVVRWSRRHRGEAVVLMQFRAAELVGEEWPDHVRDAAQASTARLQAAVDGLVGRFGDHPETRRRVRHAVIEAPYALVRRALEEGGPITVLDEQLAAETARAVVGGLAAGRLVHTNQYWHTD